MHLAFCLFPLIVNVIHSFIMAASEGSMSGGYLDEKMADPIQRSTLLQQHLQRQPYAHLIRAHGYAGGNDDDVDDDEEQKRNSRTRRKRAHGRRRNRYDDDNYDEDDDDSLSVTTYDSEEEARLAQEEWEESIGQLNLALQVMVLPFFGKWLGRKMSYWLFSRYQRLGWTSAFFGLEWLWTPNTIVPGAAVALLQP